MPRNNLPPFPALRAFHAIGRKGGIRKAASELGISHAIVSRHLSSLEQHLSAQLYNRQSGALTSVGQTYFERIRIAISEMEAATSDVIAGRDPTLVIWSSPGFALLWLTRRLPTFKIGRNQPVIDLRSTDTEPDLGRSEADGDLRYWPDSGPTPTARGVKVMELARPPVFPVAAPGFLQSRRKEIETVSDIMRCPLIEEGDPAEWIAWFDAHGVQSRSVLPPPIARYGQAHLTVAAAKAGQGIALSNHYLVAEDLAAGRLEAVQPSCMALPSVTIGAYVFRWSSLRDRDPTLTRFQRWLRAMVAQSGGEAD